MRKIILFMMLFIPFQVHAFECIVKLDGNSASIEDRRGELYLLDHNNNQAAIDDCSSIRVEKGKIKAYFSNEEGYPQELGLSAGQHLTMDDALGAEEGSPPFVLLFSHLKQMLSGDRRSAIGSKRAFTSNSILGMPTGIILPPARHWKIAPQDKLQLKSLQIIEEGGGTVVAYVAIDERSVFNINGNSIHAGHSYHWITEKGEGDFQVLSNEKARRIREEAEDMLGNSASSDLRKYVYATVYSDHNLIYDASRVLRSVD